MGDREWSPTMGVSSIVALKEPLTMGGRVAYAAGTLAMVVEQRPNSHYRYKIMFAGDPLALWQPADKLRLVQGIDTEGWWRRRPMGDKSYPLWAVRNLRSGGMIIRHSEEAAREDLKRVRKRHPLEPAPDPHELVHRLWTEHADGSESGTPWKVVPDA